jgi:hypothetical protein
MGLKSTIKSPTIIYAHVFLAQGTWVAEIAVKGFAVEGVHGYSIGFGVPSRLEEQGQQPFSWVIPP